MLLVPQTAAATWRVLCAFVCLSFPPGSQCYYVYIVVVLFLYVACYFQMPAASPAGRHDSVFFFSLRFVFSVACFLFFFSVSLVFSLLCHVYVVPVVSSMMNMASYCLLLCVFFTLNHHLNPSTSNTTSVRADSIILGRCKARFKLYGDKTGAQGYYVATTQQAQSSSGQRNDMSLFLFRFVFFVFVSL